MIMLRRLLAWILLWSLAGSANADPLLLLLLRMVRDQAITKSLEAGVEFGQRRSPPPVTFGYPPSTRLLPQGEELQGVRALIDESFLHLAPAQRDAVYSSLRQILDDPRNAESKSQIMAEFALKAREVRDGYRSLEDLPESAKRDLVAQAREGYKALPSAERGELLDALKSRMLPIPREFNDTMLVELSRIPPLVPPPHSTD